METIVFHQATLQTPRYLSNPKPGHTTGGSGRGARRSGRAGSRKIGCQQNCSPSRQASLVPPKASKTRRLNVSREARTSEILCKPTEEPNQRFTSGARSALCSWLPTSGTTPFCLCKPFSCKACPGICEGRVVVTPLLKCSNSIFCKHSGGIMEGRVKQPETQTTVTQPPHNPVMLLSLAVRTFAQPAACWCHSTLHHVHVDSVVHKRFRSGLSPVESKTRTHNGRVGSARRRAAGGAGRRWAERGADISVALEANRPSGPPAHCKQLF